jgi:sRNA-binding carbon storage regulator CsrA
VLRLELYEKIQAENRAAAEGGDELAKTLAASPAPARRANDGA